MSRLTVDALKLDRDGHLAWGQKPEGPPGIMLWPVTIEIGYDAEGHAVACRREFMRGDCIEYGDGAVSWETTGAGRVLREWRLAFAEPTP